MSQENSIEESQQTQSTEENNMPREPTLEELKIIRGEMLKMCQSNYKKFLDSLRELPVHPAAMHQCFLFFDTGALWMKEMIEFAPLVQKPLEPTPPPETLL